MMLAQGQQYFCLHLLVWLVLLSSGSNWDNNQVADFKKTKSNGDRTSYQTLWGHALCNHLSPSKCYFPALCMLSDVTTTSERLDGVPSWAKWADGAWFPFQRAHGWYNWSRQSEDEMIPYPQFPTHPHGDILILLSLLLPVLLPLLTCQAIELYSSEPTNGTLSWLETSSRCGWIIQLPEGSPPNYLKACFGVHKTKAGASLSYLNLLCFLGFCES